MSLRVLLLGLLAILSLMHCANRNLLIIIIGRIKIQDILGCGFLDDLLEVSRLFLKNGIYF